MIAVCSMFRDSITWQGKEINQVHRYFEQMLSQTYGFQNLEFLLLEGDSQDNTYEVLSEYSKKYNNIKLVKYDLNESFDSTLATDRRIKMLSQAGDYLLSQIKSNISYDAVLWIESDLIINKHLIQDLDDFRLVFKKKEVPVLVAPYIALGNFFYDTWAFRDLNGNHWSNTERPHNPVMSNPYWQEMSSVGSCVLIDGDLFHEHHLNFNGGALVELCCQARKSGAKVYADKSIVVNHPNTRVGNRWV